MGEVRTGGRNLQGGVKSANLLLRSHLAGGHTADAVVVARHIHVEAEEEGLGTGTVRVQEAKERTAGGGVGEGGGEEEEAGVVLAAGEAERIVLAAGVPGHYTTKEGAVEKNAPEEGHCKGGILPLRILRLPMPLPRCRTRPLTPCVVAFPPLLLLPLLGRTVGRID